jgi:enoyl-CoA hydratase/carnithine racemase
MTFSTIVYEQLEGVARITLNRPERANALNQTMLAEIGMALDRAEQDPAVRALVVQGAGGAFSSGFDLKEQMERRPSGVAAWEPILGADFATVMRLLARAEADHRGGPRGLPRRRLRARARL